MPCPAACSGPYPVTPAALLPLVGTPIGPSREGQRGTPAPRPRVLSGVVGRAEGPRG